VLVLARLGNLGGAFAAGLLLGVVESVSSVAVGAEHQEIVGLVLLRIVLLLRPQGLFDRRSRPRRDGKVRLA
jgi:branched-chain amino acid transport system permease protein